MLFFTPMTLGEYITIELERRGWDYAKLSREINVSWQRAQRLALDEPKRIDGSPPVVRPATIEKVAKAFGDDPKKVMDKIYFVEEVDEVTSKSQRVSLDALSEGLSYDDQNELLQIALLKWRKKHGNDPPPALETSQTDVPVTALNILQTSIREIAEEMNPVSIPGILLNAYTGALIGPSGPIPLSNISTMSRIILQIIGENLSDEPNENLIQRNLADLRNDLNLKELDQEVKSEILGSAQP